LTSGITAGPDGNIWFNERGQFAVAKMTPAGLETQYLIPGGPNGGPNNSADPIGITSGPDGNLWVTDESENVIWKVSTGGTFTRIDLPTPNRGASGITVGADGNLWFGEPGQNKIGRMTTAGVLTEFAIPTSGAGVAGVATGPDGNVWFTENTANQLAMIMPAGEIQEFPIPTASSLPRRPTAGPDGNVWFPEGVGKIGEALLRAPGPTQWWSQPAHPLTVPPPHGPWYLNGVVPSPASPTATHSAPGPAWNQLSSSPNGSPLPATTQANVSRALGSLVQQIARGLRAILS
jgi:virginiamycin B lyase